MAEACRWLEVAGKKGKEARRIDKLEAKRISDFWLGIKADLDLLPVFVSAVIDLHNLRNGASKK